MSEIRVSLFKCLEAYESKPVGLDEIRRLIVYDADVKLKTGNYREIAHRVSRDKANSAIKQKMVPAFSVGVLFTGAGRRVDQIVGATGLAMCDIDHIDRSEVERIKQKIVQDPHTLICYETISGEGLRVIYCYDRGGLHVNCEAYPAAWKKGNEYYCQLTGCNYDTACSDFSRLSGLAHDPEAYFNPEAEPFHISDEEMVVESIAAQKEPGRPRKTYERGSQHATPEEAWPSVQRSLGQRGLSFQPGHRHDYVVHAAFLFNRFGVDLDDLTEWAAQEWGDLPKEERNSAISHCYRKGADEHGILRIHQPGKNKRNSLMSTTEIRTWMEQRMKVVYNVVTDQLMYRLLKQDVWQVIDEREEETLRCRMEADSGKRVLPRDVKSVLRSDFSKLVHPIRDYISGLAGWDGQDRVSELAAHLTAEPVVQGQTQQDAQQDLAWALHKWLVAMVVGWLSDTEANHQIFTLIGEQGIYKTTFFRYLLPPPLRDYFWENTRNSFSTNDDKLATTENCLVEIEEVEAVEGHDMSDMKGLVTSQTIKARRPYAPFRSAKVRLASFCASGNQQRFLTDMSGNRRWLCFRVTRIDNPRLWQMDYPQLYAQLRQEYNDGFQYYFDKKDERRVERLNEPFRVISVEEQLIASRLRKPRGHETPQLKSSSMIAIYLTGGHLSNTLSVRKIGDIMHRLGYRIKHRKDGDYFYTMEIPYTEIQTYLSLDETIESPESESTETIEDEELTLPF